MFDRGPKPVVSGEDVDGKLDGLVFIRGRVPTELVAIEFAHGLQEGDGRQHGTEGGTVGHMEEGTLAHLAVELLERWLKLVRPEPDAGQFEPV